MLDGLVPVIERARPDLVLSFGDTVSTLAAALSAVQHGIPLAHVEAGERSRDAAGRVIPSWSVPEEMHRVTTDHLSALLLCATRSAADTLRDERVAGRIAVTGDIMYDLFLTRSGKVTDVLERFGLRTNAYLYCTVHRQRNTTDPRRLQRIVAALDSTDMPVLLPLHPRTREALLQAGMLESHPRIRTIEPVGYDDSITLARNAWRIVTDSGGLTREAYFCGVPSVCVDDSTAWHVLCDAGWCALAGADTEAILAGLKLPVPSTHPALFGDGHAADATVRALAGYSRTL
jgi:UDP-N-acetylglucosamine 2-epimerase (non-hydrolysing)/UDP-GlcNAc3NAcA epimerase